jgi:hypothetical protein
MCALRVNPLHATGRNSNDEKIDFSKMTHQLFNYRDTAAISPCQTRLAIVAQDWKSTHEISRSNQLLPKEYIASTLVVRMQANQSFKRS